MSEYSINTKIQNDLFNLKPALSSHVFEEASVFLENSKNSLLASYTQNVSQECKNAIELAYEQVGITEDLDEDGIGHNSGEILKYGGKEGDAWCASFVSWLYGEGQGAQNDDTFGYQISVSEIKRQAGKEYWGDVEEYSPKPGDIMIQKENGASHTGLVVGSDSDYIYTIEGNAQDAVRAKKYNKHGDEYKKISGYVKMNEWTDESAMEKIIKNPLQGLFEDADKISNKAI